jgi:hypothetical protein
MILRTVSGRGRLLTQSIIAVFAACGAPAFGGVIAYQVPAGVVGNQADAGGISFGMDFTVNSNVIVSQLGVFDSSQNGLIAPIQAAIFDRVTGTTYSPIVNFAAGTGAGSGTLSGGSRFLPITPLLLHAGFQGSIVAFGYGRSRRQFVRCGHRHADIPLDDKRRGRTDFLCRRWSLFQFERRNHVSAH